MTVAERPTFPPLLQGMAAPPAQDPFELARAQAALGCDAGLVVHDLSGDVLRAAIVFAPEMDLRHAAAAFIVCGVGFQNALGALAPPEVSVHLEWDGGILINGASCGRLRMAASGNDLETEPDWIVVGLEVPLRPSGATDPGTDPSRTWLSEEGCVDVDPAHLLEAWARHTLLWLNRWLDEGGRGLHGEWRGIAHGIGEEIHLILGTQSYEGTFMGVDEDFGMLLRSGTETQVLPLTLLLQHGDEA